MAPEQVMGKKSGPKTDVYGFGATFYQALTGQLPFPARSPAELFRAVLTQPLDLAPLEERGGSATAELFGRFMAKKPADRPAPAELPELLANLIDSL